MDTQTKFKMNLLVSFVSILCIVGLAMFLTVSILVKSLIMDNLNKQLDSYVNVSYSLLEEQYPGKWRSDGDKLYKGSMIINGDTLFVDKMKEQTDTANTIFLGNTSIASNVMKDNNRIVSTNAADAVTQNVLKQGKEYSGTTEVAGVQYVSRYLPIKDSSNKVIGMWFVGVEYSTIKSRLININLIVAAILLLMIILSAVAINFFTNNIVKSKVIFSRRSS